MQLELTELLVCPRCGPPHGLIAFVDRMENRRIATGHLDCPICERRHAILGGTVWFGRRSRAEATEEKLTAAAAAPPAAAAAAATAAALLGAPGRGETILCGPGAESLAAAVADLRPGARMVSFGPVPSPPHARVHSLVAPGVARPPDGFPLRSASLDGLVLLGDAAPVIDEAARVLRPGARLVILDPGAPDAAFPGGTPLEILAADPRAWVAVRV